MTWRDQPLYDSMASTSGVSTWELDHREKASDEIEMLQKAHGAPKTYYFHDFHTNTLGVKIGWCKHTLAPCFPTVHPKIPIFVTIRLWSVT